MRKEKMIVLHHEQIAHNIYEIILTGSIVEDISAPGQFVHVKIDDQSDLLLRRPISIAEFNRKESWLKLIYRAEGAGTKRMAQIQKGSKVDILGPLGNGFPIYELNEDNRALIVGGGIGVPPLYELSKQLVQKGVIVQHVLGFHTEEVIFYDEKFEFLGDTWITTVDGSKGYKGFVTDVLKEKELSFDVLFSCGPSPMLKAIESMYPNQHVYISLEERMGCGIGACFACVCPVKNDASKQGYKKICTDGPVFKSGEVVYGC
ncbi:dihydroorotate dehydrogenase electron transfer subunit [Bacillus kexueae]|uniref:dihydroorotate dehydrogenase electron transfer subunit n=1 Tax=Aeribacillus kexueae TaxID=2078952 RepID=UPI001FAEE23D|nr:dihydroorotate dehydrogenase electron transfer subunit [Bacillus kexueae]